VAKWTPGTMQRDAAGTVVQALAQNDMTAAKQWVDSLSQGTAHDGACASMYNLLSQSDPDQATAYANRIQDIRYRTRVLRKP